MSAILITELFDKKSHVIKDFSCGVTELDTYIKEKAGQETKKNVSAVYVLHEQHISTVIGYFTLHSYSIGLQEIPDTLAKKLPRYPVVPAILLGRLAVDSFFQKKGIGEYLLFDALKRSFDLSKQLGSFAVIVHAKNENSRKFYEKYGFTRLAHKPFTVYISMKTIKAVLSD